MVDPQHYTYRVTWSEEDSEFVALCAEFPSLSFLSEERGEALEGITDLVSEVVLDMVEHGEKIPKPIADTHFSGKFQVRIPPEHHRVLVTEAAEQGISLNRYVSMKLA
ncbi:MAG: toxin-antitoxin system HicB family antitoxin [Sulfitobacter sp.]|nr:MAG: toxin-antitoxin system HicB family antitoxin [Sulfitobacter sp.]